MQLKRAHKGFTLIEISIVLVIIGLILGGILNAQSIIRNARTKDRIQALNDMVAAAQQFRDTYGQWPGDYSSATASLPGLSCPNGNANGVIAGAETTCATESMIRANLLRGTISTPQRLLVQGSNYSLVGRATAPAFAPALAANWVNVVLIQPQAVGNLDCDMVVQIDRAVDDGNVRTGNFRATPTCGAGGADQNETILVTSAAFRLN